MKLTRLWIGITAAPVVWLAYLQAAYAMAPWSCTPGQRGWMELITATALVAVLGACWLSWQAWRAEGSVWALTENGARHKIMALSGLSVSALFALLVLASAIPVILLSGCE